MGEIHHIFSIPYANPKAHYARESLKSPLFLYAVRSEKWKQIFSTLKPFASINYWCFQSSLNSPDDSLGLLIIVCALACSRTSGDAR